MSRRFGRTQKRRMREAVATAESQAASMRVACEMNDDLLRKVTREKARLESVLDDARDRLRDMHIALPPSRVRVSGDWGFERMAVVRVPDPMRPTEFILRSDLQVPMDIKVHELQRLIVRVQQSEDRRQPVLHCIVEVAGKAAGYAISAEAFRQIREHSLCDMLAPEISKALTRELVSALKGKAGR